MRDRYEAPSGVQATSAAWFETEHTRRMSRVTHEVTMANGYVIVHHRASNEGGKTLMQLICQVTTP
jgi:hypothetical protein